MPSRFVFIFIMIFAPLMGQGKVEKVANPADLSAAWFDSFQNKEENKGSLDRLIAELQTLKDQLDPQTNALAKIEVERLILNVQEVEKRRQEKVEYEPILPLYHTKYTLSDWLLVLQHIQTLEERKQKLKTQIQRMQLRISAHRKELDYLQLEYPLAEPETYEKLMLGLQMMNTRFDIEYLDLGVNLNQKRITAIENNLTQLRKEEEVAQSKLDFSNLNQQEIEGQIEKLKQLYTETSQKLLDAEKEVSHKIASRLSLLLANIQLQLIQAKMIKEHSKLLILAVTREEQKREVEGALAKLRHQLNQVDKNAQEYKEVLQTFQLTVDSVDEQQFQQIEQIVDILQNLELTVANDHQIIKKLEDVVIEKKPTYSQYITRIWNGFLGIFSSIWSIATVTLFRINDYPVSAWVLIRALLIFLIAIFFALFFLNNLRRIKRLSRRIGPANVYILARIGYYLILIFGFMLSCVSLGFHATNFVIIAGALGVGVGLGLQSIVNNFFSGLVVLFNKTLKVGDFIETEDGYKGSVKSINMQNIHMQTFEGKDVILPNADLVNKTVVNWTMYDPFIRFHIPFGVEYGTDKEVVEKIAIDVAERVPYTVNNDQICPKPKVWLVEFGDSSLNFELVVWVNLRESSSKGSMFTEYLWEIETELTKQGIVIPFPQSDIYIKEMPEIKK